MVTVSDVPYGPLEITPEPSEAELAAIVASLDLLWPKPAEPKPVKAPRWRMASRPWTPRSSYGGWR